MQTHRQQYNHADRNTNIQIAIQMHRQQYNHADNDASEIWSEREASESW